MEKVNETRYELTAVIQRGDDGIPLVNGVKLVRKTLDKLALRKVLPRAMWRYIG